MNSSTILNVLRELGFRTETLSDGIYSFKFEGLTILYCADEGDDNFLRLALLGIYEGNDENRIFLLDTINEVNKRIKYTKTLLNGNNVCVMVEAPVVNEEKLDELLSMFIYALRATYDSFYRLVNCNENFSEVQIEGTEMKGTEE